MASPAIDREAVDQAVARGSELLKQGKLDDAQKAFRAALLLDGENARVLALLGLTHFRAQQFDQARPIYEELVERAPTDASHRLNLGLVYLKLGESDKAIGSLEASRALDPSQGRAVSYLGLAYARAGRFAEAYRSFLLAGQTDLAAEIEVNLTAAERDGIQAQLRGPEPRAKPATVPPPAPAQVEAPPPDERVSMPEIVVDRSDLEPKSDSNIEITQTEPESRIAIPITQTEPESRIAIPITQDLGDSSEAQIAIARAEGEPAAPSNVVGERASESLQFVLPAREAVPEPAAGQSIISRAVEVASPSSVAIAVTGTKVSWGSTPPVPLSQLATEHLVRPEDGDSAFEITASGALVIRVIERVVTRLDGIHVTGGELEYEPAMRRSRGHQTDDKFHYGGTQLHSVSGNGYLIAVPDERNFTAVALDDDILYLREDLVFAFEATLRWENGNVPGLRGKLPVVQFRGDGAVAIRTSKPLVRVKLPASGLLYVDATRLAGWIGRVIPRAVVPPHHGPMGDVCVECTGEGVVLVDPGPPAPPVAQAKVEAVKAAPPPPPQKSPENASGPIELDVVKSANWLADDDEDESGTGKSRDEI